MFTLKFYVERNDMSDKTVRHPNGSYSSYEVHEAEWFKVLPDPENAKQGYNRFIVRYERPHEVTLYEKTIGGEIDEYQKMISENMHGQTTEVLGA